MEAKIQQIQQIHSANDDMIDLKVFEKLEKFELFYIDWTYYNIMNTLNGTKRTAKVSRKTFDKFTKKNILLFNHEVDINMKLNHPAILKIIGYSFTNFKNKPRPTIIMEYAPKNTLYNSLMEDYFNDTNQLICFYGIASGMSYLHSHNLIHRNLNLETILLDESFYPKITNFNKCIEINQKVKKGPFKETKTTDNLKYLAPEVFSNLEYSKSSDVYSFGLIMYQILCKDNFCEFLEKVFQSPACVIQGERPEFIEPINDAYKKLIERCWAQDPKLRPTFDQIVSELKTNPEFLSNEVDKDQFYKYIKFIEDSPKSFENKNSKMPLNDILKLRTPIFEKSLLTKTPNFLGNEVDISKFKSKTLKEEKIEYKIIEIHHLDKNKKEELINLGLDKFLVEREKYIEKYFAHVYLKEINNFYKHEIINFSRKLNIISQINHPAILKFVGYSSTDFDRNPKPVIITEYGIDDLTLYCSSLCSKMDELCWNDTLILINIYGIASAMAYLHFNNIIHRDLKPSNIIFVKNYFPKVTGFDISKFIENDCGEKSDKIKGTPAYLAPEVYSRKEYSKSSDVYSFGLTIFEFLTGKKPFQNLNSPTQIKEALLDRNERPTFDEPINEAYKNLIERCWSQDPKLRPTFDQILFELNTNPLFISDGVDEESFFEYVRYIDEYKATFDSSKRIQQFDNIVKSRLHTFSEIAQFRDLNDMYETETNNILFDFNYFNLNPYTNYQNLGYEMLYFSYKLSHETNEENIVGKSIYDSLDNLSKSEIKNFSNDFNFMAQLKHPSLLKYLGYNQSIRTEYRPTIIVEYNQHKTLQNFLEDVKINDNSLFKKWNETKKLIDIFGIASAMSFLHSHDIIHCDLKPSNICLDDSLYPKLHGFSLSKIVKNKFEKSDKIKGTPIYLAPEIYLNKVYSKSSDVYSFALVIYEIQTEKKPFNDMISPVQIKNALLNDQKRPKFNEPINKAIKNLIERCWSQDPKLRPTFDQIISELKTNSEFLTEEIDKDEFFKYIKFIEESPKLFDQTKPVLQFNNNNTKSIEFGGKINIQNVYETEYNEILFDYDFINMNNFEKTKLLRIFRHYKLLEIIEKKTKNTYLALKLKNSFCSYCSRRRQNISRSINNSMILNHPSILKIVGYSPVSFKNKSHPVIITESGSNGSLSDILKPGMKDHSKLILNETKKLIIIYGIASAMSYLHTNNIIYCNLKPSNIFLDEFLFPKILNFHFSKEISKNPIPDIIKLSMTTVNFKEDIYLPPEKHLFNIVSSASDVYAFSMILYQLITNEEPFSDVSFETIRQICEKKIRPKFKDNAQEWYKELIEKCWSDNPKERPTFDEILYHIRTDPRFFSDSINKEEYQSYIEFIEKSQLSKNNLQIDDFIKTRNKTFRKIQINFNKLRNTSLLNFQVNIGSIDLKNYEKQNKIGSGGFGVVYKIIERKTSNPFAAKISIYEMDQCEDETIINLSREIDIMSQLNHPTILQYIGFSPYNFKNKPKPVIITEYASNGSLDKILELERLGFGNYDWNDTKKLINIYGIASGMAYLHKLNILHRDLKPANILLDDYLYPKIADFGLSKVLNEQDDVECTRKRPKTSGFKGTYAYCAPEIISKQVYTKYCDIYAFGMIVYEIITGEKLYEGFNQYQLIHKVMNGYRPPFNFPIPYCFRKLIEKCWDENDHWRPSFEQIVESLETNKSFITQNVNENEYLDYILLLKEKSIEPVDSEITKTIHEKQPNGSMKYKEELKTDTNLQCFVVEVKNEEFEKDEIFLDLKKFKRQEMIIKTDTSKLCKFLEIETGHIYMGQILMQTIKKIEKDDFDKISKTIKIINEMKHPSLLKFIGYSPIDFKKYRKPIIVTEYASNGPLSNILEIERMNNSISGWNDTKKLMNIYGIASGMLYLHSHDIVHRSLKPSSIYLDEMLTPKIGDYGLSTYFMNSENITYQSISGMKATPIYSAPEVLQSNDYTKASDVYAFAFIVYEIMTNKIPFDDIINKNQIFNEVVINKKRPKFDIKIPYSYRRLIERCWLQEPNERPSFEIIVYQLKNDDDFITDKISREDYQKYIKFIDDQFDNQITSHKIKETE